MNRFPLRPHTLNRFSPSITSTPHPFLSASLSSLHSPLSLSLQTTSSSCRTSFIKVARPHRVVQRVGTFATCLVAIQEQLWVFKWSSCGMLLTPFAFGPASLNTDRMSRNVMTDVKTHPGERSRLTSPSHPETISECRLQTMRTWLSATCAMHATPRDITCSQLDQMHIAFVSVQDTATVLLMYAMAAHVSIGTVTSIG